MNTKKILLFILFAFGLSWLTAALLYASGVKYGSGISTIIIAVFYMLAPAASAVIVQKGIYKEPVRVLGLDFKKTKWLSFLWVPVINILFCLGTIGAVLVFGNLLHIKEFGFFSLDQHLFDDRLKEMLSSAGRTNVPNIPIPTYVILLIVLIPGSILGGLFNTIFTFGEELGWRGFLYNETRKLGYFKSNLLIGTIWGLWHAPLILQGHNYSDHRVVGVFMMVPFCISLAMILSWLRTKTRSVLAPSLMHGMVNAAAGGIVIFCYEGNDLVGNIAGVAGVIALLLIVAGIWIFDRKNMQIIVSEEEATVLLPE